MESTQLLAFEASRLLGVNPVRGPAIVHDDHEVNDPLLRAIAELRGQVDRLIDEQKASVGGILSYLEEDPGVVERPAALAVEPATVLHPPAPAELAPKARRAGAPVVFDRLDEPSPTPPRPVSTAPPEPAPASRSEDPRERLDALAKHLDRKLRQAAAPNGDPAARPAE